MAGAIVIRGARVHNLKNIDLEIPRDRLVVITGVSGSGKSSLAFDTLYAEGQRRYLESLGTDARQMLRQMEKPDVDSIDGLPPAVAIQAKTSLAHPRSTVGTVSEVFDYLRLLFARVGEPICPRCESEIRVYATEQIVDRLLALPAETRLLILAPIDPAKIGGVERALGELARHGFTRVMIDGAIYELGDEFPPAVKRPGQIDLLVDRLVLREGMARRLADSLETASRQGDRVVKIHVLADHEGGSGRQYLFSQKCACLKCGGTLPEITPSLFSFNTPQGACPVCGGLGFRPAPGRHGKSLQDAERTEPCAECEGTRLSRVSRSVRVAGYDIGRISSWSIEAAQDFFSRLPWAEENKMIGQKIVAELQARLRCIAQLGLGYLSLDRPAETLSGGEMQRLRLATQLGAGLAGVLYILDEPSIGLHQRDNQRLLALLKQLRDAGNSVVVVEHDPETILAADHVIDLGPGAGMDGGQILAQGTPDEVRCNPGSRTGQYLSGKAALAPPARRRKGTGAVLKIKNARARNLKNVAVEIPVGAMTCVSGVSGAGKSTLVLEVLFPGVARRLRRQKRGRKEPADLFGWENFERVIGVDQRPIGRTSRSNPATYTGLFDPLRELFSQLPEARLRGYTAERFSFNARGGRCEVCAGDGVTRVEMYFLPEMFVTCAACKGRRYSRETLEIKFKGLSIADVLDLTVDQALELLGNIAPIHDRLRTLRDVGLGYLCLGQRASTLSGGEAQRVKLARELARRSTGRTLYILDEPSTGLHFDDVQKLLDLLNRLTDLGNTVVIVEHNLDIIKSADYVIDLGPEAGERGGEVVAQGTPEEIALAANSFTGQYLKRAWSGNSLQGR
jgi:excinuclease ABC subunit A